MSGVINDINSHKSVDNLKIYTLNELEQVKALEYAIGKASLEVIEYLLQCGCRSSRAMDIALDNEYVEIAELLHKYGCKPSSNTFHMRNLFELKFMKEHGYTLVIDVYDICHYLYPTYKQQQVVKQLLEWNPCCADLFYTQPSSLYDETLAYILEHYWNDSILTHIASLCKLDRFESLKIVGAHIDMKIHIKDIALAKAKTVQYWKARLGLTIEDFLPELFTNGSDKQMLKKLHLLDSQLPHLVEKYGLVSFMLKNRHYRSLAYLLDIHGMSMPGKNLVEVYREAFIQFHEDYVAKHKRTGSSVKDLYLINDLAKFCKLFKCFVPREFLVKYSWREYDFRDLVDGDGNIGADFISCVQTTEVNDKYYKYF